MKTEEPAAATSLFLTVRERLLLAAGITALVVLARLAAAIGARAIGGMPVLPQLEILVLTVMMLVPFPAAIAAVEAALVSRSRFRAAREIGALLLGGVTCGIAGVLYAAATMNPSHDFLFSWLVMLFAHCTAGAILLISVAIRIAGAVHRYRVSAAEDARRFELELESVRRTREAVEQRTSPRVVIAVLENVAARLDAQGQGSDALLFRLARHQRFLLLRPSTPLSLRTELHILRRAVRIARDDIRIAISGDGGQPAEGRMRPFLRALERALLTMPPASLRIAHEARGEVVEVCIRLDDPRHIAPLESIRASFEESGWAIDLDADAASLKIGLPMQEPPRMHAAAGSPAPLPAISFVFPLLFYFGALTLTDLQYIHWGQYWSGVVAMMASAACWLLLGPLAHWMTSRVVHYRFLVAAAFAAAFALAGAAAVTAATSLFLFRIADSADTHIGAILSALVWRNMLAGLAICANSLAGGFSRRMIASRAAAARAREETLHAEAREIEARFHPHFLFNSLNSIIALMSEDPAAAAKMCRQLASLVARTVAHAGVQWWSVDEELRLVSDYMNVQSTRFGDRLRLTTWDVQPAVRQLAIPRLILQPLVENIFKHAVAASHLPTSAGLAILKRRGRRLEITLWNSTKHCEQPATDGKGLAFVSRRVDDAGGAMVIDRGAGDRFEVRCSIPIDERRVKAVNRGASMVLSAF